MAGCKVIGVLGGVGSGKSEAVKYLESKYKTYTIKADDLAHRLYKKGQPGYKAIIRICGKSVLDDNREINRSKLSSLLYQNPQLLSEVNKSIHPMVYRKTVDLIAEYKRRHKKGLITYEAAIIPDNTVKFIDEYWYVYTPQELRFKRLKDTRGYTDDRIKEIMKNQPTEADYRAVADEVLVNDGNLAKMKEQIDEIIKHSER